MSLHPDEDAVLRRATAALDRDQRRARARRYVKWGAAVLVLAAVVAALSAAVTIALLEC